MIWHLDDFQDQLVINFWSLSILYIVTISGIVRFLAISEEHPIDPNQD